MTSAGGIAATRRGLMLELRPLLSLAGPVVTAELGWMTMGLVDTIMVGRVSPEAIGAVGIGSTLSFTVALAGIGLLLGLDYEIAHAFGSGCMEDVRRWLVQGAYLAVLIAVPAIAVVWIGIPWLAAVGIRPEVLRQAIPYGRALSWSLLPLFLLTAVRRYLQALGLARPVMVTVLSANLINVAGNWVLVYGHLGIRSDRCVIHARRCCPTSSGTGVWACPWVTYCVSVWGGAWSDCGSVCASA